MGPVTETRWTLANVDATDLFKTGAHAQREAERIADAALNRRSDLKLPPTYMKRTHAQHRDDYPDSLPWLEGEAS